MKKWFSKLVRCVLCKCTVCGQHASACIVTEQDGAQSKAKTSGSCLSLAGRLRSAIRSILGPRASVMIGKKTQSARLCPHTRKWRCRSRTTRFHCFLSRWIEDAPWPLCWLICIRQSRGYWRTCNNLSAQWLLLLHFGTPACFGIIIHDKCAYGNVTSGSYIVLYEVKALFAYAGRCGFNHLRFTEIT